MSQPIMLCPIQYVYESPMLMPQPQEQQIHQNQTVVFNVQNPPPWIQNRPQTQNQVVYVQQVPNNYQHYIHPNMVQSLYQPQLNYQLQQPMLTQDNRQFVHIPNLTSYNTAQNQITQPIQQQIKSEEQDEKMPVLTQMLSQKVNASNVRPANNVNNVMNAGGVNVNNVVATNINNIVANSNSLSSVRMANVSNVNAPINVIRPVTQNQQVQTDISASNKGRPRNSQPQVITINPMQQHQYVPVNQKQDVIINISRPAAPHMRPEVPQHIRSKIPSSISVKSVYRPIHPRPVRPYDVMRAPQSFYYQPNFANIPNPEMRNIVMNTESSQLNINSQEEINQKPADLNNIAALKSQPKTNNTPEAEKTICSPSASTNGKFDLVKIYNNATDKKSIVNNTEKNIENMAHTEEKLIRNTVYTQARGLVLNDKQIVQGQSPKRTIHNRLEEERLASNMYHDSFGSSNKYMKVEDNTSSAMLQSNGTSVNSSAPRIETNSKTQSSSNNFPVTSSNIKSKDINKFESSKTTSKNVKDTTSLQSLNTDLKKITTTITVETEKNTPANTKEKGSKVDEVIVNNIDNSVNTLKEENMLKNLKPRSDEMKVLTHVLDGYIIQESNVAFPIQKPAMEKEGVCGSPIPEVSESEDSKKKYSKEKPQTDTTNGAKRPDTVPHLPWIYLNKNIETEEEMEFAVVDKDGPFTNVQKPSVQAWTTEQLTQHLVKHEWNETAAKLGEEEIDGESLLLVNKDQLLAIGVCELHAEAIAAFTSAR